MTRLPDITPLAAISSTPSSNSLAYALPNIRSGSNGPAVLGESTMAPIEATDQGWRILGVLWYWWVLVIGGVIATGKMFQQTFGVLRRGS